MAVESAAGTLEAQNTSTCNAIERHQVSYTGEIPSLLFFKLPGTALSTHTYIKSGHFWRDPSMLMFIFINFGLEVDVD